MVAVSVLSLVSSNLELMSSVSVLAFDLAESWDPSGQFGRLLSFFVDFEFHDRSLVFFGCLVDILTDETHI